MKNLVRIERTKRDISQEELAQAIGVSRQTIYAIESTDYLPSTLLALKISFIFQLPVEEIFFLESSDWDKK